MAYKKIVVPTDFSPESEVAFEPAIELAKACGGQIVLATVTQEAVNLRIAVLAHTAAVSPEIDQVAADLVQAARKKLDAISEKFKKAGVPVKIVASEGLSPAHSIIEIAKNEGADLIAVSTHGRSGLKRLLLGSVTERIVREAHCPVLVVRK